MSFFCLIPTDSIFSAFWATTTSALIFGRAGVDVLGHRPAGLLRVHPVDGHELRHHVAGRTESCC